MPDTFSFDVFLSHSTKDKAVVRDIATQLTRDGVRVWFDEEQIKPGDSIPSKIEEGLDNSRVLVLCMSANAFGSDWAQLESGTFRFRDPLNKERRFLPLRLDDAPIKGSLGQFLYVDWRMVNRMQEYAKLIEACGFSPQSTIAKKETTPNCAAIKFIHLEHNITSRGRRSHGDMAYAFADDGKRIVSGAGDMRVRLWDFDSGRCLKVLGRHKKMADHNTIESVYDVAWSPDQRYVLSAASDNVRLWNSQTGRCVRVFKHGRTFDGAFRIAWSADSRHALTAENGKEVRLWNIETGRCLRVYRGHTADIRSVDWSPDNHYALSGGFDRSIRMWDVVSARTIKTFVGHSGTIWSTAWSPDQMCVLSGSDDNTVRVWDVETGRCLRVLEGHTASVWTVAWSSEVRLALSGSHDRTLRLWDIQAGRCLCVLTGHDFPIRTVEWSSDGNHAFSGDSSGFIRVWDLSEFVTEARVQKVITPTLPLALDQVQYTNAKVLLVGDTNAGKTGLTHRLANGKWKPSGDSTVGAWSTQWQLKDVNAGPDVERELWLWDFGGQADQRLIHQLYMDRTALILLLFNADQADVLPGLRDWQTALRRSVKNKIPHFLVAGRVDTGFKASRGKLLAFAQEQGFDYHETSAKTGEGCDELRAAMITNIPWERMEKRTSPRIFKLIKDEILKLRDEWQVLHTFKELRELIWRRLSDEPRFTDETLETVIGLLDGPGVVKELEYGTYILLAPEWINAYAQAVIRTLRNSENDLGVLPSRSIAEGKLIYQSIGRDGAAVEMKRLPLAEERVLLGEMERQLEQRGLCLRQGDKLVFPSHCGRDRPAMLKHPSIFVSYAVKGFLDDIYATLVVKLADSESFTLKELWRDAADFVTLSDDHHMGIKLTRETASDGDISVYFGKGVTQQEQVIFTNYIHAHLEGTCENSQRLRHYVCPHCHTAKGNTEALMQKLMAKKEKAEVVCDVCDKHFKLWDSLEKKFASQSVRDAVLGMQREDDIRLTTRRQGKLLVLEVGARITSANQKWFEIPTEEDDGIDIQMEFTNEAGNGVGKGLCLQLKAGNSFLTKRKTDGAEIFQIKKQRWIQTWMNQPFSVMLVIGTLPADRDFDRPVDKRQFESIRWMEITSVLKQLSKNGTKPVTQIEFKGEEVNMTTVMQWRKRILDEE